MTITTLANQGVLTPRAIYRIAEDTFTYHYQTPQHILTVHDYTPHMQPYAEGTYTYWHHETLKSEQGIVCQYTGYTRNQMLAAMLNVELSAETELAYSERVDVIADEASIELDYLLTGRAHSEGMRSNWVYPSPMEHSDRVYAQHQANRYFV
jgi:hypothetical protein